MTVKELISLDASKVRRDSNLMLFYIETFKEAFGYAPNCAGCTFNSDWYKLVNRINGTENLLTLQKEKTMATFQLKKAEGKILSFKKDGVTHRKYDTNLTEEFVLGYLSNGSEEEIEQRKKLFSKLPKENKSEEVKTTEEVVKDNAQAKTESSVKQTRKRKNK